MALTIGTRRSLSACHGALLALALAGCSGIPGFGRSEKPVDPNAYPANYKTELLDYLQNNASEMENVRNAALSAPALTQLPARRADTPPACAPTARLGARTR